MGVIGAVWLTWWWCQRQLDQQVDAAVQSVRREMEIEIAVLNERLRAQDKDQMQDRAELAQWQKQAQHWRENSANLQSAVAEKTTLLEAERKQALEKLSLLQAAKEDLKLQFKNLANEILEEKSQRFTSQNQTNLGQLLDPLKLRLQEFQSRVELFYDTEGKQRSALSQQVVQLMALNQSLGEDAKNLTSALKGTVKTQGQWGELILERVLEASGLRKGVEYQVQSNFSRVDGSRAQPDVVIHLPDNRHLVVDAKVSLLAYENFANADTHEQKAAAQQRHLESIRAHIKGLSVRNYQELHALESLDFVVMFVPIEPAFMLAVAGDHQIFMEAWHKNVLLASPSTLLFVVRTVAHLWRQEAQNKNAQEIAQRGAELYDRLHGFVSDLEKVGERLQLAQTSYASAFSKLSQGRGNVIRQAELLRNLGVKPTKSLAQNLVNDANDATENGGIS